MKFGVAGQWIWRAVSSLFLTACIHTQAVQVIGPDGHNNWYAISCNDEIDCFRLAGESCQDGYRVREQKTRDTQNTVGSWSQHGGGVYSIAHHDKILFIKCR